MTKPYTGDPLNPMHMQTLLPEHVGAAMYIGEIAVRWSRLESLLATLFGLLLFGYDANDAQNDPVGQRAATDAFEAVRSFRTKVDLLLRVTESKLGEKSAAAFRTKLGPLESTARSRHNIIHGRWAMTSDKPPQLVRIRGPLERPLVYEASDFLGVLDAIRVGERELAFFFAGQITPQLKSPLAALLKALTAENPDKDAKDS